MPGQGKSSAARAVAAGVALDPTAELRIWVPDANFDFEAFRPRCSRYVLGAEDEKIEEILIHLRELHAEVQSRGELLVKFEIPASLPVVGQTSLASRCSPVARSARRRAIFSAVTPAGSRITACVPRPSTRAGVRNCSGAPLLK